MKNHVFRLICCSTLLLPVTAAYGEDTDGATPQPPQVATAHQPAQTTVQFSFERSPWRAVLEWLADESDLALHVGELPQGTFTYSDPQSYTPLEALDRVNLFLIPEGFSVVRSEQLLSVISLKDARSLKQLDAMARLVNATDLPQLGNYDVVKCLIPLGEVTPAEAAAELKPMQLMVEPVVLPSSNQLLVTDTAGKLKSVCAVLRALETTVAADKPVVESFQLEHVTLEQLLEVAAPHLAIEAGQLANEQINISADSTGMKLYVSGQPEAVSLLANLIKTIDLPANGTSQVPGDQLLKSHPVRAENLSSVYDVLHTLLANEPIRLSMEPTTNTIVALAAPSVHETIAETITELQGVDTIFSVVQLKTLEPHFVIALLDEMFDLSTAASRENLKIDADLASMRLFLRGKKDRVAEIQQVVEQLDATQTHDGTRVVPLFGPKAERVLEEAMRTWKGKAVAKPPRLSDKRQAISERIVGAQDVDTQEASELSDQQADNPLQVRSANFVSTLAVKEDLPESSADPSKAIGAKATPHGILLQSDNEQALALFEEHVRNIARSESTDDFQTVVYYLKYSSADDATRLLADLLEGATSVVDQQKGPQLINGSSASSSGLLGSYLRKNDGAMMVNSGTLTVISDARLNRLICLGTTTDIELVQQYLELIDKDASLTEIETRGRSHVIELQHTQAEEIADVVRDAYGDRVALTSKERQAQAAQLAASKDKSGNNSGNNLQVSKSQEAQMTLAVHEQSNALVVTAPEPLFLEVQQLIQKLDQQGAQAVEVVWYPNVERLEMLKDVLNIDSRSGRRR
ncbi:secretin N-terminal domain-containing protein [Aureliella helgolandensis]|uniref:Bacterial type II/III secretion system short domain protein n=1 Tax=Aureliella helgolandensis TaxID=2527968 RepID=A0A518G9A9_9BACT|nr:secretin N-terminal domain-containing protein [Aureliella helgolandensis]QDV25171.1 Bacterial type II/III secretion system short domain protein [Aureliella helgolandensis]